MSYLESMRKTQKSRTNPTIDNISKSITQILDQELDYKEGTFTSLDPVEDRGERRVGN